MKISRIAVPALALAALLVALPAGAVAKHYDQIRYPSLGDWKIPVPEREELKNGMVVFLLEDHELPLIEVEAIVNAGERLDPADKVGLVGILGTVLRTGGAGEMSGDEMDEYLEGMGAVVETNSGATGVSASMSCLKEDFDQVLEVFRSVLMEPRFDQAKIDLSKVQLRTAISRRNDSPNGILNREFSKLIYGPDSPYARVPEYATVDAITRDDIVTFHQEYFKPNTIILGVAGDFNSKDMVRKLGKAFGSWKKADVDFPEDYPFTEGTNPGVFLVEKTDLTQSSIRVGHLGTTIDDPDYPAIEVMNELWGRGFGSRLMTQVRSKKGLAYSVYGQLGANYDRPGLFTMTVQTKLESTVEATLAMFEELNRLLKEAPTDEELNLAKDSILNSFVFNFDSPMEVVRRTMTYERYGYPLDFMPRYRAAVEKVTAEDVLRVAKAHLKPRETTVLVVGNPAEFDKPLNVMLRGGPQAFEGSRPIVLVDISIPEPGMEDPGQPTQESLAAGARVMKNVIEAMGGRDVLAGLEGVKTKGRQVLSVLGDERVLLRTAVLGWPDFLRIETDGGQGKAVRVYNGVDGYLEMGGTKEDMPAKMKKSFQDDMSRMPFFVARRAMASDLEAELLGSAEVDGVMLDILQIRTRETNPYRLYVEQATGRIVKVSYHSPAITGGMAQTEKRFEDYREVDGLMVPFRTLWFQKGQQVGVLDLDEVEVLRELRPDLFDIAG